MNVAAYIACEDHPDFGPFYTEMDWDSGRGKMPWGPHLFPVSYPLAMRPKDSVTLRANLSLNGWQEHPATITPLQALQNRYVIGDIDLDEFEDLLPTVLDWPLSL